MRQLQACRKTISRMSLCLGFSKDRSKLEKNYPLLLQLQREDTVFDKDMDIQSVMSLKRESTLQNIKQQQSIKDAAMYVGTIYCLLPDGTEPEVQRLLPYNRTVITNRKFCTRTKALELTGHFGTHHTESIATNQMCWI